MKRIQRGPIRGISLKLQEEECERRMDFMPEESAIKVDQETNLVLALPQSHIHQVLRNFNLLFLSSGCDIGEPQWVIQDNKHENPFLDSFSDPFCKLSLKETSDFVKTFPVPNNGTEARGFSEILAQNGVPKMNLLLEAPPTPGRPIFSFSNTNIYSRKCFPSKWDDAEKWLVSGNSCNDSPSYNSNSVALFKSLESSKMYTKQCSGYKPHMGEVFAEKSRITEKKVSKVVSNFQMDRHHSPPARAINGVVLSASADVHLKGLPSC